MKDYNVERQKWEREAHNYAVTRNPLGCMCDDPYLDSDKDCEFCRDEREYMRVMHEHADVLLSDHEECPF